MGQGQKAGADLGRLGQADGGALHIHNALIKLALLARPLNGAFQHCLVQVKDFALGIWGQP